MEEKIEQELTTGFIRLETDIAKLLSLWANSEPVTPQEIEKLMPHHDIYTGLFKVLEDVKRMNTKFLDSVKK